MVESCSRLVLLSGVSFKIQQQLQICSCSFKKILLIIFLIFELIFPKNDQKSSKLWVSNGWTLPDIQRVLEKIYVQNLDRIELYTNT